MGGFFESNPNPDFWHPQPERFFGNGFEKSIFDKRFSKRKWNLSSIYIRRLFLNPYLSCFLYVCSVFLRQCIFQVIKKNNSSAYDLNSYNFTIVKSLFYSRNVCVQKTEIYSCFEKGCRKKCTRQSRKVLWVVFSSLFFK